MKHQILEEDRYDRREGIATVSRQVAVDVAQRLLGGGELHRIECLAGGFSNANYLVQCGIDRLVLRFFLGGESIGQREVGILRLAKACGISAPDVIDFRIIDGRAVAVLRFIDGILLSTMIRLDPNRAVAAFTSVGAELARIHSVKSGIAGLFGSGGSVVQEFPDFCAGAKEYLLVPLDGLAGQRLGPELTNRIRSAVEQHWHHVYATYTEPALVHCDFNPKNILVSADVNPQVAAVLDWEFSMSAHPMIDLGNFFRFELEDYPSGARSAFIDGYRSAGGFLPERWERAARLLDLTSMSDFLSRPQEYPKTFRTALRVVEATLRDIESWES